MNKNNIQPWMRGVLLLGGAYNLLWFIFLYYFPDSYINWVSEGKLVSSNYMIFLAIGVGIVGLCMLFSILKPIKYWYLIAIAFVSKLLGGIFVYTIILNGLYTKKFLFHLLMNDLIWLLPLGIILGNIYNSKKYDQ